MKLALTLIIIKCCFFSTICSSFILHRLLSYFQTNYIFFKLQHSKFGNETHFAFAVFICTEEEAKGALSGLGPCGVFPSPPSLHLLQVRRVSYSSSSITINL